MGCAIREGTVARWVDNEGLRDIDLLGIERLGACARLNDLDGTFIDLVGARDGAERCTLAGAERRGAERCARAGADRRGGAERAELRWDEPDRDFRCANASVSPMAANAITDPNIALNAVFMTGSLRAIPMFTPAEYLRTVNY